MQETRFHKPRKTATALVFLVLLGVFWLLRPPHRPDDAGTVPAPATALPPSAGWKAPALASPPGAATLGPPQSPLHGPALTNAWLARRAAFRPPSPEPLPGAALEEQLLLVSGPRLLPAGSRASAPGGEPTTRHTHPFFVQFDSGEDLDGRKREIEAAGARVHGYFPRNAWLVELDPDARQQVEALPFVRATLAYDPPLRIEPWLQAAAETFEGSFLLEVAIQTFLPEDASPLAGRLRGAGAAVRVVLDSGERRSGRVLATLRLAQIPEIAAWAGVQWVEEHRAPELLNNLATSAGQTRIAPLRAPWGLDGAGQTVGHADTGLDTGDTNTVHRDLRGRVTATAWGRPNDWSDHDGHGTHTAGSVAGDGSASGGQFAGAAPAAHLFHQSVEDAAGDLAGLYDLYALFAEAHAGGARIHADSWGADTAGGYDSYSREADEFAWDHPEFLPVFASGNAGVDIAPANGVVDPGSVGSPATAKNVLTVGASESDRAPGTGGLSAYAYGTFWSADYPANPIRGDLLTWSATPGPPYQQGMAAFSSRGPTADGRVKPDVAAPGCDVLSLRSSLAPSSWLDFPASPSNYTYNVGTSMATPLVAGAAALLRQALERYGHPHPSAALLRAMLTGGARSLAPGQYGTGTTREIPAARPNSVEGHGQIDLAGTLFPEAGDMTRIFDRLPVPEQSPLLIPVPLVATGGTLRAVLAWSDFPAAPGAGLTLVNDLDLAVLAPDGTVRLPETAGASPADIRNPIERIDIAATIAGVYTVRVCTASLPYPDPERFMAALYLRGAFDQPPLLHHAPGTDWLPVAAQPLSVGLVAHYHREFAPGEAQVRYHLGARGDLPPPAGTWAAEPLTSAGIVPGGWRYPVDLPAPAENQTLFYRFTVNTGTRTAACPTNGHFSVSGYLPVFWTVAGYPDERGVVSPGYGTQTAIPGEPVTATATELFPLGSTQRLRCMGYLGEGGIPPFGLEPAVTFTLHAQPTGAPPPRLTWIWSEENALTQNSAPPGAVNRVDWFSARGMAQTAPAPEVAWNTATGEPYALAGWSVDGARWPAATGPAPNPATQIPLPTPKTATAHYAPFWIDADGNELRDAWEVRWTGLTNSPLTAADDPDEDGWTNFEENLDNTDPQDPASFPTPPAIPSVTLFDNPVTTPPPFRVEALITDAFAVAAATLLWRPLGTSAWTAVPMTARGDDRYDALFTPPDLGSATSEYCVAASDVLGFYDPRHTVTSAVLRVWSELPHPALDFNPRAAWRLEGPLDEPVVREIELANFGRAPLEYTLHLLGEALSLEQETPAQQAAWDSWSSSTSARWQPAARRSTKGAAAWYCGSTTTWKYANYQYSYLDTPPLQVASNMVLVLDQWIKTEHSEGEYYWDGGILTCSLDGGLSWELLTPIGGYPHRIVPNPASPFPDDQPCFGGLGEGWHPVAVDLASFAGQSLIVSFEFGSDGAVNDEGWYIDNVRLLSPDAPPAALALQGATAGQVAFRERRQFQFRFTPDALPAGTDGLETFLHVQHNDPDAGALYAVAARYGYAVDTVATGPGTLSFGHALLFAGDSTTLVATAAAHADVRTVATNGLAWAPTPATTRLELPFGDLRTNVAVQVAFGWTLAGEDVPLWWLDRHGLTGDTTTALYADTDGDGMPNWKEYVANTSPTNPLSDLRIFGLEPVPGGWRLRWRGGPGRTAIVERAAALDDTAPWNSEAVVAPAPVSAFERTLTNAPAAFFRIRALPPGDPAPPAP